jgi:DNA-binding Lrp family transcriptional regulator
VPPEHISSKQFSAIDKKLLKILLSPEGEMKSTKNISKEFGIPVTTIRRRRKRLEKEFLKIHYVLDIEKFGWRRVDFFISIMQGKINRVAYGLMKLDENNIRWQDHRRKPIDLRIEAIVKDNSVLLNLLEQIKEMEGVKDVIWSEIVSVVGRKISIPSFIIDKIG